MARPFHYHVWDLDAFDGLPPFSSTTISVPRISGGGVETKTVYSLKRDMDQLRTDGSAKGIVDASETRVGTSTENKDLWVLKVGNGSSHKVLFTGCHHAREWIAVEIPYLVAEYLIQNFVDPPTNEKEKRIKHLLMNRQIWFVPMVNPDGHIFTTRQNRMWRPNRNAVDLPAAQFDAPRFGGGNPRRIKHKAGIFTGIDLNRNYASVHWGEETFLGSSAMTSRDPRDSGPNSIWCGPSAGSEVETTAITDLIKKEQFRAGITYHNFSQLLLFADDSAADAYVQFVGRGMRDLIDERGNPYTYESGSALYATTGDLMNFQFEVIPGRPSFTPELRPPFPSNPAFQFSGLPESQIGPTFVENLAAALALINCAGFDAEPANRSAQSQIAPASTVCQAVLNCWEVFKRWEP